MKFGKVTHPENIKFTLPSTHPGTKKVLSVGKNPGIGDIRVGCAKWNRRDLKNFYPRGTKEELEYYASQFNSIEFNATFYRMFPEEQFITWQQKTPGNFLFFPKIPRIISHNKRLKDCERQVDDFAASVLGLEIDLVWSFYKCRTIFRQKILTAWSHFLNIGPKKFL
ncbi:hypothetical protein BH23BAC2_BH23BAC2_06980 [soil metagenome]